MNPRQAGGSRSRFLPTPPPYQFSRASQRVPEFVGPGRLAHFFRIGRPRRRHMMLAAPPGQAPGVALSFRCIRAWANPRGARALRRLLVTIRTSGSSREAGGSRAIRSEHAALRWPVSSPGSFWRIRWLQAPTSFGRDRPDRFRVRAMRQPFGYEIVHTANRALPGPALCHNYPFWCGIKPSPDCGPCQSGATMQRAYLQSAVTLRRQPGRVGRAERRA